MVSRVNQPSEGAIDKVHVYHIFDYDNLLRDYEKLLRDYKALKRHHLETCLYIEKLEKNIAKLRAVVLIDDSIPNYKYQLLADTCK